MLLVASLHKHQPDWNLIVSCPTAGAELKSWLALHPRVSRFEGGLPSGQGWNIKPALLLALLTKFDEVTWIDSDIVLTSPLDHLVAGEPDLLIATEECFWGQLQGGTHRTTAWGLSPSRSMPATVNTGLLRVTRRHVPLLSAWQKMLSHPQYLAAQSRPWYERPLHMIGDQEVLTALLASQEYGYISFKLLRRGSEIAQCFGPAGFTPWERMRALVSGDPPLIHAMGPKPWLPQPASVNGTLLARVQSSYRRVSLEVSPYTLAASRLVGSSVPQEPWMTPRSLIGRAMYALSGGRAAALGFPLALFDHCGRWLRRALRIGRYSVSSQHAIKERPF